MPVDLTLLPEFNNSVGDLDERSRSTNPKDWPIYSYSQGNTWNACEWSWYLSYREGYSTEKKSIGLDVGSRVHEGADIYYGNDCDRDAVHTWMKETLSTHGPEFALELKRAFFVLKRYVDGWAPDHDKGFTPVATELHIFAPFKTNTGRNYWLQGYVDLLIQMGLGKFAIWDHKTSDNNFWTLRMFQMDPQTALYCGIMREIGDYIINTTVLNQLNTYNYKNMDKVDNEKLFDRLEIPRTDVEITNVLRTFGRLVDENIDRHTTPRKSLNKACSGCQFMDACYMELKGFSRKNVLEANFNKREQRIEVAGIS